MHGYIIKKKIYLCIMQRIMIHIERLLLIHDCVIIPKVGGFVLQKLPAVYRCEDHSFSPAQKEIVFNPTLQHNDGLLIESYMKLYGVDFNQAQHMLDEDTEILKVALQKKNKISLGVIGSFCSNEEGKVIFTPAASAPFSISSYGLDTFRFPTLKSLKDAKGKSLVSEETAPKRKDIFYIPVNTTLFRTAVASTAAVALFLLISTPVKNVNQAAYTASFIPTDVIYMHPDISVSSPIEATIVESVNVVNEEATESSVQLVEPALKATESTPKTESPVVKETPGANTKYYHIVVASLPSMNQANKYVGQMDKSRFTQAGIVERDGKVRIYAAKFTDKDQAEQYLTDLRKTDHYKDAWMFISR